MKKLIAIILSVLCVLSMTSCKKKEEVSENTIRVGMQDFTENLIIGELFVLALEDAGYQVERVTNIASSIIHTSIVDGDIDIYPEYIMTGCVLVLEKNPILDPNHAYRVVKNAYEKQYSLTWLDYSKANAGQALVIKTDVADKLAINNISQLQAHASEIRFSSQGEFNESEDGILALEKIYQRFYWKSSLTYDGELEYSVLENDAADVIPSHATDGHLVNGTYRLLDDDKQVWPQYNVAPVIRLSVLEKYPRIKSALNAIIAALDTHIVTMLNAAVDVEGRTYEEVAKEFYDSIN